MAPILIGSCANAVPAPRTPTAASIALYFMFVSSRFEQTPLRGTLTRRLELNQCANLHAGTGTFQVVSDGIEAIRSPDERNRALLHAGDRAGPRRPYQATVVGRNHDS